MPSANEARTHRRGPTDRVVPPGRWEELHSTTVERLRWGIPEANDIMGTGCIIHGIVTAPDLVAREHALEPALARQRVLARIVTDRPAHANRSDLVRAPREHQELGRSARDPCDRLRRPRPGRAEVGGDEGARCGFEGGVHAEGPGMSLPLGRSPSTAAPSRFSDQVRLSAPREQGNDDAGGGAAWAPFGRRSSRRREEPT